MSGVIPDAEIDAIRQRAELATEGPWTHCGCGKCGLVWPHEPLDQVVADTGGIDLEYLPAPSPAMRQANAAFIAAARTDVPKLLAERDDLRAQVAALREALADCRDFAISHGVPTATRAPIPVLVKAQAVLSDTAQAAAEYAKRQRLEGAEAFFDWLLSDVGRYESFSAGNTEIVFDRWKAEMEREAKQ